MNRTLSIVAIILLLHFTCLEHINYASYCNLNMQYNKTSEFKMNEACLELIHNNLEKNKLEKKHTFKHFNKFSKILIKYESILCAASHLCKQGSNVYYI